MEKSIKLKARKATEPWTQAQTKIKVDPAGNRVAAKVEVAKEMLSQSYSATEIPNVRMTKNLKKIIRKQ